MSLPVHPQEVEVSYNLPANRRELSIEFKRLGKSQREIAKLLGVTDAAVSQYISAKRASDVAFPDDLKSKIQAAAPRITSPQSMVREIQAILQQSKDDRFICRMHEQVSDVPQGCDVCFK